MSRRPSTRVCDRCHQPGATSHHLGREWYWFHPACLEWYQTLLTTTGAAKSLGVTIDRFFRLTEKFDVPPEFEERNPKYACAASGFRWDPALFGPLHAELARTAERDAKRREAARKGVETKHKKTLAEATDWKPSIPIMPASRLRELAIDNYNLRNDGRNPSASERSNPEFLARIMTNFLRHECSDYDAVLADVAGRVGRELAYDIVRDAIDDAIEEAYPDLPWDLEELEGKDEGPASGEAPVAVKTGNDACDDQSEDACGSQADDGYAADSA